MKNSGFYNNRAFVKGEVIEYEESVLKGLDPRDYEVVMTAKDIEAKAKADAKKAKAEKEAEDEQEEAEKLAKADANKMHTGNSNK